MAAEVRRCHQCGRSGTRQFVPYPEYGIECASPYGGAVSVAAGAWGWECANSRACRSRWPKTRLGDE